MKTNYYKILILILGLISFQSLSYAQNDYSPDYSRAKPLVFDDDDSYIFIENLCALKRDGKWGFIDVNGNWVIQPIYNQWGTDPPFFSGGICLVSVKAPDGYSMMPIYIDKLGNQLFKNQKFDAASPFFHGLAVIGKASGPVHVNVYSFIDTKGNPVAGTVTPKFRSAFFEYSANNDGIAKMWDEKLSAFGIVKDGKWLIAAAKNKLHDTDLFSEGLCAAQNSTDFKWGFIDLTGNVQVPYDFQQKPQAFSSGRALVQDDNFDNYYIDQTGNNAFGFKCSRPCFNFHDGKAVISVDRDGFKTLLVDVNGNTVQTLDVNADLAVNSDGRIVFNQHQHDGLTVLNPDGSVLINDILVQKVYAFGCGRAYVRFFADMENKAGFIDETGNILIVRSDK